MVSVYMNPEKLEEKIAALTGFATSVKEKNDAVDRMYNNEPIQSGGYHLKDIKTAIEGAANAIEEHAKDLSDCKTTMVNLNSNGVATHDLEGGISIEVPDDSAGLETTDKFQKWAQGATDAHDLRSGEGKLPSGRSIDEVRESMKANKDDTTYANSVIDGVGPENLTKIGSVDPDSNKEAPILGEILATASHTWSNSKSERNADLIALSIHENQRRDRPPYDCGWDRIPILNRMIGNHDSNGDGVNDLYFDTAFLRRLGTDLERIKPGAVQAYFAEQDENNPYPRSRQELDPLSAVIDAMTNNPEAAAQYFGKNGTESDENDISRVAEITKRQSIGDNQWTNNLAIISSRMSEYGKIDTTKATPEQIKLADQAALGTSVILNTVGEEGEKFSSVATSHFGNVLKNYAAGVDHSIQLGGNARGTGVGTYLSGTNIKDATGTTINSYGEPYWGGVPTQPTFSNFALSNLIGNAGLTEHGLDGLRDKMSVISRARLNYGIQNDALSDSIQLNRRTQGFIAGAIEKEAVDRGREADAEAKRYINLGMKITKYIPGVEEGGNIIASSKDVAQSLAEDSTQSALEQVFANNEHKTSVEYANYRTSAESAAEREIILELIKSGAISREEVSKWGSKGESATIFNEDGTLNQDVLDSKDPKIGASVDNSFINIQNHFDELANKNVTNAYNAGRITFKDGQDAAKGVEGEDHKRVDPNKFGDNAEEMRKQEEEMRKQEEEMRKQEEER